MLEIRQSELLVADESMNTAGCAHNDMGMRLLVGQDLNILLDGCSTIEHGDADIRQELGEAIVLILNLESQFTGVAHDQYRGSASLRLLVHLLEGRQYKDGSLAKTGLGLAENIVS